MSINYAKRMNGIDRSTVREILKVTVRPEIISFAGGLPAPELFPVEEIKKAVSKVLYNCGQQVLQYATTEGYEPFRAIIAQRMNKKFATKVTADEILILSGSQQALDLAGKVFIDEGDVVLMESPSYLAAISAFNAYGPNLVEVPTDDNGIIPEELEKILKTTEKVKFLYAIPDFQNPTGRTWSLERRKAVMEIANKYDLPIIEDNPYGELRFKGEILPSLKSFDTKGLVMFNGTFSKIFTPGLRLGWVCANKDILEKFVTVKQSSDLHTSEFNQRIAYQYMLDNDIEEHIVKIMQLYGKRCETIIKAMEEEFPPGVSFTRPEGGLFLWVTLPEGLDSEKVFHKAIEQNVAFVPGSAFYPNSKKANMMRINYSNMPEDRIIEGIKRLGKVLKDECAK